MTAQGMSAAIFHREAERVRRSPEWMAELVNQMSGMVKVLLPVNPRNTNGTGECEGVWVLELKDRQLNRTHLGILMSNPLVCTDGPKRGDVVQFAEVNPEHKPYIIQWADGSGS